MPSSNKILSSNMHNNMIQQKETKKMAQTDSQSPRVKFNMPFTRTNFIMMGCCLAMIIIGFLLMSGGGSATDTEFNPDIFSTRRIVIGPTITFLGFLLMAFAIIWTPKKHK